jgi:uncharacterized protein (TIGR00297 family)
MGRSIELSIVPGMGLTVFSVKVQAGAGWIANSSAHPIAIAALVTLFFAILARKLRGVTRSGTAAGAAVCFLLYAGAGPGAFAALVSVFVLTWLATRVGYKKKQRIGVAEPLSGRNAAQVLANLGVAAACAAIYLATRQISLLAGVAAALSEAAGDTVSSEVGQARGDHARLITTWKRVPPGTDGGVSLTGTLAGVAGATVVSLICVLTKFLPVKWLGISVLAAVIGIITDSFLGALLERRGFLNNEAVNFLSTLVAAGLAMFLAHVM